VGAAIVAGGDAPPILALGEEFLEIVARFVDCPVVIERCLAALGRLDAGMVPRAFSAARNQSLSYPVSAMSVLAFGSALSIICAPLWSFIWPSVSSMTSGFPAWLQTTWSLEFSQALVRPIQRERIPFLKGSPPCGAPQMRGVDHDALRLGALARERFENAVEDAAPAPTHESVVECLVRPIGRVLRLQTVLDHIDDAADDAPVPDARQAMRQREKRRDHRQLAFAEQKQIIHRALSKSEGPFESSITPI